MQEILHELEHILLHPLIETAKMLPILFLAYLFMEWLEAAEGSKMAKAFNKAKKSGPLFGSLMGLIPQCGFSGAIAGMYAAGTVTAGTLLAVMLSTSDEMLPVLVSARLSVWNILMILALKFVIAVICGFASDIIIRKKNAEQEEDIHAFCEREHCSCKDGIFISALKHTVKILGIIFIVLFVLNHLIFKDKYTDNRDILVQLSSILFAFGSLYFLIPKKLANKNLPKFKITKSVKKTDKTNIISFITILMLIPITIFSGIYIFDDRKYYFICPLEVISFRS